MAGEAASVGNYLATGKHLDEDQKAFVGEMTDMAVGFIDLAAGLGTGAYRLLNFARKTKNLSNAAELAQKSAALGALDDVSDASRIAEDPVGLVDSIAPRRADDLAILNLQPGDSVATASANALRNIRGDVILQYDQFAILQHGERLTIVAHGSATSVAKMSAAEIAGLLSKKGLSPGYIELCACKSGLGVFAQRLADLTGVPVKAPLGNANVLSGPLDEVGGIRGVLQVRDPVTKLLKKPGELMETFYPKRTTTIWEYIAGWF